MDIHQKTSHHPARHLHLRRWWGSVTFRLTLWYVTKMGVILLLFLASTYATLANLSLEAGDAALEKPLSQKAEQLVHAYQQSFLPNQFQPLTFPSQVASSSPQIVLVLHPDGTVLDRQGPLTDAAIQQLQSQAESSNPLVNLTLPLRLDETDPAQTTQTQQEYRVLIKPVLDHNTRVAIVMVGLPRQSQTPPGFWLWRALIALLIAAMGGYWLAGIAMRPVKKITQMAQEINATDLRRRLNWKRRDEFGQLAATFDQMLARLEAAFKRQTQFTADASHELRTPLTIVNLEINRALSQCETGEEYRQALEQIQTENEQMTAIVNNLLLLARADTGQLELHRERVDLSDIALGCVERMLPLAKQKGIVLSTGALPELVVWGDPQQLTRLVMNLLENAIKYTGGIGQRVRVELACEQGSWAVLWVQDDGPGIAPEHLPYVFERFYRADKARHHSTTATPPHPDHFHAYHHNQSQEISGGSGLGLAIVQSIVLAHRGVVRVESKLGRGSLFEIKLPLLTPTRS